MENKKIDLERIFASPQIGELGKKTVTILPKDFSDNQRVAVVKAVLYVISADGVITDEEKQFFTQLCADLKADSSIMEKAVNLSDDAMFEALKTVTDEQEAYILSCLNNAAYADNELAAVESKLIDAFAAHIQTGEKPKDFFTKILTF